MRQLEHQLRLTRAVLRRGWARLGRVDPELGAPSRLVIRLDEADLPGSLGEGVELTVKDYDQVLAQAVQWLGPVQLTVLATHSVDHPCLPGLVRFAHRLECPTLVVTDGSGLDEKRAEALLDAGLSHIRVMVGGVSDQIHRAVVGNSSSDATGAVAQLVSSRRARGRNLDIEVGIPWQGPVTEDLRAIVGWARQIGADGVRILAPYRAERMPANPELLDAVVDEAGDFCRTREAAIREIHAMVASQDGQPGVARSEVEGRRRRWKCPVGGQRLVITAVGRIHSCPFKAPIGRWEGELRDTFSGAGEHLNAVRSCGRACAHVELVPEPIWG
jgi:MoaA/NifB/PqqE/SkfB family radical SAM enzyme